MANLKDFFSESSKEERIQQERVIQMLRPDKYFPTYYRGTAKFDAVIQHKDKIWIVEMKTRQQIEPTCLIEKYKLVNLMKISKKGECGVIFITVDETGYYLFNLNKIDVTPYFCQEWGWKTKESQLAGDPKCLLDRYRLPKHLATRLDPNSQIIDDRDIINKNIYCEKKRYENWFGENNNQFLTKINQLLEIPPIKRIR